MATDPTTTSVDDELRTMLEGQGPWASVELPAVRAEADAETRREIEWKNAADDLLAAGAPADVVERLGTAIRDLDDGEATTIVAHADAASTRVVGLPVAIDGRRASYGAVPRLLTELDWRRRAVNHLVVLVDRTGADVIANRWDGGTDVAEIDGSHDVISKPRGGGWSQRRFQQRAEDSWERNAEEIATEVASTADDHGAELIIVAGGPRMVPLFRDALPDRAAGLVREIDGSRAEGVDLDSMAESIERVLADHVASGTAALLADIDERGISGVDEVFEALGRAAVSTLVVSDDAEDDRTAWFLPDGFVAARTAGAISGLGTDPVEGRLVDVAARAALLSGARVVVGPATRGRDLAAVLRTD